MLPSFHLLEGLLLIASNKIMHCLRSLTIGQCDWHALFVVVLKFERYNLRWSTASYKPARGRCCSIFNIYRLILRTTRKPIKHVSQTVQLSVTANCAYFCWYNNDRVHLEVIKSHEASTSSGISTCSCPRSTSLTVHWLFHRCVEDLFVSLMHSIMTTLGKTEQRRSYCSSKAIELHNYNLCTLRRFRVLWKSTTVVDTNVYLRKCMIIHCKQSTSNKRASMSVLTKDRSFLYYNYSKHYRQKWFIISD